MDEAKGNEAHEIHERVAKNELIRRQLFAENGMLLGKMYHDKLYKAHLGDKDAPWSAYLAEISVYYSRNETKSFLRIYRKYIIGLGLDWDTFSDIPTNRLLDMIPVLDPGVDIDLWFDSARTLTPKDWKIEIRKAKGLETEDDEDHECKMVDYEICSVCGKKHKKQ